MPPTENGLDKSELVPHRAHNGHHPRIIDPTPQAAMVHLLEHDTHLVWNFESSIKMKHSCWRRYVKYLVRNNPGVPLKKLLQTYSKKEYEEFKKNPKAFV